MMANILTELLVCPSFIEGDADFDRRVELLRYFLTIRKQKVEQRSYRTVHAQDGVLLRGPHTIPAARRALDMLNGDNPMRV